MAVYRVKNWHQFQHYKDRSPPWVKLHRALLDDFGFSSLPLASKALAPMVWLLAAENMAGEVECDPDWLAFRLRWSTRDAKAGITPLIEKGFLEPASDLLAECKQPAPPETETEADTKEALGRQADRFEEFFNAYPKRVKRKPTHTKWKAKRLDGMADEIIADVQRRIQSDKRWLDGFIPDPLTYISQERWQDEVQGPAPPSAVPSGKPKGPSETPLERAVSYARQQFHFGQIDEAERDRLIAEATAKHRGKS